jgi:hypothetical protein
LVETIVHSDKADRCTFEQFLFKAKHVWFSCSNVDTSDLEEFKRLSKKFRANGA